jgi:hypothetical protein
MQKVGGVIDSSIGIETETSINEKKRRVRGTLR